MNPEIQHLAYLDKFLTWAQNNIKAILAACFAILVVTVGFVWLNWYRSSREAEASAKLLALRGNTDSQGTFHPPTASEYVQIANMYKGTKAASLALLLGATTYFNEGNFTNALQTFDRFLKEYPNHHLRNSAIYGLALCYEVTGQTQRAITLLENLLQNNPIDPITSQAKLALARLYKNTGKIEAARTLLTELKKNEGISLLGYRAEIALEELPPATNALITITNLPTSN